MKQIRRMEKRLEQFVEISVPERFEKRGGEIYGLLHGEWRLYSLQELTNLKNKLKARHEQRVKRFEPVDIQVVVPGIMGEEPEILYNFGDRWVVEERGITYWIIVGISEGDDEIDESTDQEDPE